VAAHCAATATFYLSTPSILNSLGGDYFDKRRPEATAKHLVKRLEQLGYSVSLQQPALCAARWVFSRQSYMEISTHCRF